MLTLDDSRWGDLTGGYRMKCDPRPLLAKLENSLDTEGTWHALWDDLHHQGDVGEASYAAVPHLVRIYRNHGMPDWNTYAIVAVIELARNKGSNPAVLEMVGRGLLFGNSGIGENRCCRAPYRKRSGSLPGYPRDYCDC
jgi:hypothetical protein